MAQNFSTIGINFNVFQNITFDEFSGIANQTGKQFIESIPANANAITNGYYGIIVLFAMGIWLLWMLSDITQFGLFRYTSVRALGITFGITLTFAINMVQIGYMTSFIHATILSTLYLIILLYVIISNPS